MEIFDQILNRPWTKKICKRCGNYQSHQQVWCTGCGAKFTFQPKLYIDALRAMDRREYQNRPIMLNARYIAAIHERELRKAGVKNAREKFQKYIEKKLAE